MSQALHRHCPTQHCPNTFADVFGDSLAGPKREKIPYRSPLFGWKTSIINQKAVRHCRAGKVPGTRPNTSTTSVLKPRPVQSANAPRYQEARPLPNASANCPTSPAKGMSRAAYSSPALGLTLSLSISTATVA